MSAHPENGSLRAVNAPHLVALVCAGAQFERGLLIAREIAAARNAARQ
jgi:hypothetical protein